jgi:hypothetical protein
LTKVDFPVSRRHLLSGVSAAGALGAFGSLNSVFGKAPMLGRQALAFYRFNIGDFEATIATDGPLPLADPHKIFLGLAEAEMDKQLTDNFLPLANVVLEQNALVVNTGDKLILFDTGTGGLKMFGPTTGRLVGSIKSAGIDPKDIDAVVWGLTHPSKKEEGVNEAKTDRRENFSFKKASTVSSKTAS